MTTGTATLKHPLRMIPSRRNNVDSESGDFTAANGGEKDGVSDARPTVETAMPEAAPENEEGVEITRPTISKVSRMEKVMSVAKQVSKKTLSVPVSATKRAVKSTGDAVKDVSSHLKKTQHGRDSDDSCNEVSAEESEHVSDAAAVDKDSNTSNNVQQEENEDKVDSTITSSNSIQVDETTEKNQSSDVVSISSMGPVSSFLLHDATMAISTCLTIAAYPTISNYSLIMENSIPLSVSFTWILVAFAVGYEVALFRFTQPMDAAEDTADNEVGLIPDDICVSMAASLPPKRGYSILRHVSMRMPTMRINVPREVRNTQRVCSTLTTKRGEQLRWQRCARGQVSDPLMQRLLWNPTYQRKSVERVIPQESVPPADRKMGSYELPEAESLQEDVIEPLFVMRGMDVFMTEGGEGAEDNMSSHPFLIENGLRGTPSFVVNIMSQWANVLVYFEMPSWIKDWDNIVEQEDDPDDVRALKKFLNGNDEYKNARLKMLPHVVDAPRPIRMVAPAKRDLTVHCDMLPIKWHQSNGTTQEDGRYLHPCLELELDFMATKTMRGFASLVKRYLCTMSVDMAIIVDKPDLHAQDELSACIAMWRFDKVDLSQCPKLPDRFASFGVQADTIRASMLLSQTESQTEKDIQKARDELGSLLESSVIAVPAG